MSKPVSDILKLLPAFKKYGSTRYDILVDEYYRKYGGRTRHKTVAHTIILGYDTHCNNSIVIIFDNGVKKVIASSKPKSTIISDYLSLPYTGIAERIVSQRLYYCPLT